VYRLGLEVRQSQKTILRNADINVSICTTWGGSSNLMEKWSTKSWKVFV